MATSVAECDRIMAASKVGGKVFMISEQSQCDALCTLRMMHRRIASAPRTGRLSFIEWLPPCRYWAPVVKAKQLIDAGAIGNVVSVAARYRDGSVALGTSPWVKVLDGPGGKGDAQGVAANAWVDHVVVIHFSFNHNTLCAHTFLAAFCDNPLLRDGTAKPWRYDRRLTGGGVSIDGGLHWIRPMRMLTPGNIEVSAAGQCRFVFRACFRRAATGPLF